jgi:hypothetical protein
MGLFHVRQGLGGKLSDFYIFYCMLVIELDIGSKFYAKLMGFWWLLKIKKIRRGKITILAKQRGKIIEPHDHLRFFQLCDHAIMII